MRLALILIAVAVALFALDRLLLAAEARGWIYYRKRKASPGTGASAFLELQSMLEPGRKHEIQAVRREDDERDDSGDPPSPDATSGPGASPAHGSHEPQRNRNEECRMQNEE